MAYQKTITNIIIIYINHDYNVLFNQCTTPDLGHQNCVVQFNLKSITIELIQDCICENSGVNFFLYYYEFSL